MTMCVPRSYLPPLCLVLGVVIVAALPSGVKAQGAQETQEAQELHEAPPSPRMRQPGAHAHRHAAKAAAHDRAKASAPLAVRVVRTVRIAPPPDGPSHPDASGALSAPPEAAARSDPAGGKGATETVKPTTVDSTVKTFCANVGRAATDARVAWQAAKLAELETALKVRIGELETKIAQHREWLARRDEAARRADDAVVAIYARMRPDSAASQLASLDDATASALLMKLNPRNASAILSEIPAERAARLTESMTGARMRTADEKKPS